MKPFETLLLSRAGAVATVTLARPEKLNALTSTMHAELRRALEEVAGDDAVRVLVLTGQGRAFSSGQDLTEDLPRGADGHLDLGLALERDYNPLILKLAAFPKVTVAALNGPAVGASANIALACDLVVAARSATIYEAFARIALLPDAGGTYVLPRLLGPKRALALMLLADPVAAEEALAMGLISHVFDDAAFAAGVEGLTQRLAKGPALAQRLIKQAVAASFDNTLRQQLELELRLQREAGLSPDFVEGVSAFKEKRPPNFKSH
jgi:2-(1,2-epoxy-1,2-dihydrophenyl)acetyl-CoA isomerase